MCWRLSADIKPAELQMDKGLVIDPLAFLSGGDLVAAACLRKIKNDEYIAGVLIRSAEGLFRERIGRNFQRWAGQIAANDCRIATGW
jgi:hypothetical protein